MLYKHEIVVYVAQFSPYKICILLKTDVVFYAFFVLLYVAFLHTILHRAHNMFYHLIYVHFFDGVCM